MNTILKTLSAAALAALVSAPAARAEVSEHFIIHELEQTPQEAATLIRDFIAMSEDWSMNGDFEMMGGAAIGMKICFNAMRGYVGAAGLHNLALMPCGNIAFYEEDGQSYLSMLDVGYITTLSPHPSLEEGVALARPAYAEMFAQVLAVE
ncbi:hypothetical protein SAMN05421759_106191 [Roseivivax lentus]|uniref:DUF302 domain-containing protein n=1 Tax=Roseivivax lentus TaxID=633194 RepID=A0A1N7N2P1_9RHOB|nr:hypothetical protein [Roseivivax lentus]SIS92683.1 hypothetical protein SAMN05421759_106191 [Roseivivax lentus]